VRRALAAAAVVLACGAPARAETAGGPALRTADPRLAAAVARGLTGSPTFRAIVERLAVSDLIVHVTRGRLYGAAAAATQLVASSGGYRYVRVTLEIDPEADAGLALLGHELWHALELAEAPWVTDAASVHTLYERIGFSSCEATLRCYDTEAAVITGKQVLRELRGIRTPVVLHALGLPVAFREQPRADEGEGEECDADGDEGSRGAKAGWAREEPGERDLQ
jgi:hypothetical protein